MKKIVFRTFVLSFAISTLVIFSINKLQAYFPQKNLQTSKVKVSNNNIISFFKEESKSPVINIPSYNNELASYDDENYELAEAEIDDFDMDVAFEDDLDDVIVFASQIEDTINSDNIDEQYAINESAEEFIEEINIAEAFAETPNLSIPTESNYEISGLELDYAAIDNRDSSLEIAYEETPQIPLIPIQKNNKPISNDTVMITDVSSDEIAMTKNNSSLNGMIKEKTNNESYVGNSNPWVVAKGAKYPNNSMVLEEEYSKESQIIETTLDVTPKTNGGEVKVAEMVRNILIPIPEDILKEGNLTPQLISSKRNKDLQERIEQNMKERKAQEESSNEVDIEKKESDEEIESDDADKKGKKTIFDSISSIFSGKTPVVGVSKSGEKVNKFDTTSSVYSTKKNSKNPKNSKVTKILPTEIKLSFQPNRAEISGQTLKWIEAFANKTMEDGSVVLEIRIDGTSSFELQQKRLSLLHNILINKGVEYNKINTVFTTREPNSFIIRTVRVSEKSVAMDSNQKINNDSKYYQDW